MNSHVTVSAASVEALQHEYDTNELLRRMADIDGLILAGKLSSAFVMSMLDSLVEARDFPVWKTLRMRQGFKAPLRDVELTSKLIEYYRPLLAGYKIGASVYFFHDDSSEGQSFEQAFRNGQHEVDLVRVSPRSLGFFSLRGVRRGLFYERALHYGLEKCWYEIGFALRLDYCDQPFGEWLTIATDTNSVDVPDRLLCVGRGRKDDPLCLEPRVSYASTRVPIDDEYVFVKPRK